MLARWSRIIGRTSCLGNIHDDEDQGERSTGLRGPVAHRGPFIPFSHMSIEVSLPKKGKNLEKNQCF